MSTPNKPTVVCLCGSTRFYPEFQAANFRETMAGKIVLSVGFYAGSPEAMKQEHGEGVGITAEEKVMLDELHKRKIDLADEVFVLNVGNYVGSSTLSEVVYADRAKKPIRWLERGLCPCCKGHGGFDSDEDSHECALCNGAGEIGGPTTNESDRKAAQWHVKQQAQKDRRDYRRFIVFLFLFVGVAFAILIYAISK